MSPVDLIVGAVTLLVSCVLAAFGAFVVWLFRAGWREYHRGFAAGGVIPGPPHTTHRRV